MAKIGPREVPAGIAPALRIERPGVFLEPRILDNDAAFTGKQTAVARSEERV